MILVLDLATQSSLSSSHLQYLLRVAQLSFDSSNFLQSSSLTVLISRATCKHSFSFSSQRQKSGPSGATQSALFLISKQSSARCQSKYSSPVAPPSPGHSS